MSREAQDRKERPVYSGVLRYFPKALLEVAYCSWKGNEQHNPGEALYWNRAKSTDEADALLRHLMQAGGVDSDGVRHSAKVAWRALALLEKELEAAGATFGHATDSDGGFAVNLPATCTTLAVKGSDDPLPLPNFGPGSEAATGDRVYMGEDGDPDAAFQPAHHPV